MQKVTFVVEKSHFNNLVAKITERLRHIPDRASLRYPSPASTGAVEAHIWETVMTETPAEFWKGYRTGSVISQAFIFGLPLNDTVFMFTPIDAWGGDTLTHDAHVETSARNLILSVDFYERLKSLLPKGV